MPAFTYTAVDASGNKVSGLLDCRNKAEAYRELEAKALSPVVVETIIDQSAQAKRKSSLAPSGPVPLPRTALITFTEELADLLDAGLQLEQALRILHDRQQHKGIKAVAGTLRDEIREGARFSQALKKASPSFDELYRNLVSAGEASGSLSSILTRLAANIRQLHNLQKRTVSAMIYPTVVLGFCVILLIVFSTVLMPMLTKLMKKSGQELPLITELLIAITEFIRAWWWLILSVITLFSLLFKGFISTKSGRLWWDKTKLRLPAFGPVIAGRFYAQFSHSMANLVSNGVPLMNALKLMERATPNQYLRKQFEVVIGDVTEGNSLSRTLGKRTDFPPALIDRVAIGEQSGDLSKAFAKAARKYDDELDTHISRLTSVLPMVMLVLVAIIVGVVAYSVITTIFGSMKGIGGRK
jgi:type II secretory pathway component PulF